VRPADHVALASFLCSSSHDLGIIHCERSKYLLINIYITICVYNQIHTDTYTHIYTNGKKIQIVLNKHLVEHKRLKQRSTRFSTLTPQQTNILTKLCETRLHKSATQDRPLFHMNQFTLSHAVSYYCQNKHRSFP
jgi:hypothetical protein